MRRGRLLRAGIGAVALLGLAEAGLRWGAGLGDPPLVRLDARIEYLPVPGAYTRFGNRIFINSDAMRAPELADPPPPDEARILLVGDSVVYGNHFLDQSGTIAAQLVPALRRAGADCPLAIAPVAASSWGPVNQAAFLERFGFFGADRMTVILSAHDLADVPVPRAEYIPYRLSPPLGALGDAAVAVGERLWRRLDPPRSPQPRESREDFSLAALGAMLGAARLRGIPATVWFHPTLSGAGGAGEARAKAAFAAVAARHGAGFADLTGREGAPRPDWYRDDIHLTAEGAAGYARWLAADLAGEGAICP